MMNKKTTIISIIVGDSCLISKKRKSYLEIPYKMSLNSRNKTILFATVYILRKYNSNC